MKTLLEFNKLNPLKTGRKLIILIPIILICLSDTEKLRAQVFDIKSWHGTYPNMEGSYPLTFISFRGFLNPIPHVFIRTWPAHYYLQVGAAPVLDAGEMAGSVKTGFLRIVEKIIEEAQAQQRADETAQIKENNLQQRNIELKLFNARSDYLPDLYGIANLFVRLYQGIGDLEKQSNATQAAQIIRLDADALVVRFVMVNLLQTDHGKKLEAFAEIRDELIRQKGETDYLTRKIYYNNFYSKGTTENSYAFLIR